MEDPRFAVINEDLDVLDMADKYPLNSKVVLYGWPTGAKVIGHCDDGPIIQPEPCCISDYQIFFSKTGPPRIIL